MIPVLKTFLWIPTAFRIKSKLLKAYKPCMMWHLSQPYFMICSLSLNYAGFPSVPATHPAFLALTCACCFPGYLCDRRLLFITPQLEMHLFKETFLPCYLSRSCHFFPSSIAVCPHTYHHQ